MAEEAIRKELPKKLSSTYLNTISDQVLSAFDISEDSESKRSMDDQKHDASLEHSMQSSELIAKSSDMTTDEVDILGCSDENIGGNFPVKDFLSKYSETKIHTTEKCEGTDLRACDIESSHKVDLQVLEPKQHSVDTFIETSESNQLKVDITSELSTDNVLRKKDMSIDSHQVIEQCMDDLVRTTTNDVDYEIKYSSSTRHRLGETVHLSQQNKLLRNLMKVIPHQDQEVPLKESSNIQDKCDQTEFADQKMSDSKLKTTQLKRTLKDIGLLSSCIEEIGRMNEIFKNEIVKMLTEIMLLRRSTRYFQECLDVLQTFPTCTIIFEETDRHPQARVNVYEFGVDLLHDHSELFKSFKELLVDLNAYRLKFIDLSENFSLIPFEFHVGEYQSKVLDMTFGAAIKIYEDFFKNDGYEILHQEYVLEHEELKKVGLEFDVYLKKLSLHHGVN